jgi:hypothetical protein
MRGTRKAQINHPCGNSPRVSLVCFKPPSGLLTPSFPLDDGVPHILVKYALGSHEIIPHLFPKQMPPLPKPRSPIYLTKDMGMRRHTSAMKSNRCQRFRILHPKAVIFQPERLGLFFVSQLAPDTAPGILLAGSVLGPIKTSRIPPNDSLKPLKVIVHQFKHPNTSGPALLHSVGGESERQREQVLTETQRLSRPIDESTTENAGFKSHLRYLRCHCATTADLLAVLGSAGV